MPVSSAGKRVGQPSRVRIPHRPPPPPARGDAAGMEPGGGPLGGRGGAGSGTAQSEAADRAGEGFSPVRFPAIGVLGVLDGVPGLVDAVTEKLALTHVCVRVAAPRKIGNSATRMADLEGS